MLETIGQACHASVPRQGKNAIELMSRAVQVIHGPWTEYLRQKSHPLLGRSTCQVTKITGGTKVNILPAQCHAWIDSRLIPGPSNDVLITELERMLEETLGDRDSFLVKPEQQHNWLDCPQDAPVAKKILELCRQRNGQEEPAGVDYFADTGPFSAEGITSVLFGPGDIRQAHTADEYIELDQLAQATEIMLTLFTTHAGQSIVND
jgi:acetylornithine deacetylase